MIAVITATLFGSLEAMREGWGPLAAPPCDHRAGAIATSHPASRPPTADARSGARPQDGAARPAPVGHVLGLILYCAIMTTIVVLI